jgi:hypothetical protein
MGALAGYPNVRRAHVPPRLSCLGIGEIDQMEIFANKLYVTNLPEFKPTGGLRPFIQVVLATNIKNFNDKYAVLGRNNRAICRIIEVAESCGISYLQLKEMSRAIEDDFRLNNVERVEEGDTIKVMLQNNNDMTAKTLSKVSGIESSLRLLTQRVAALETASQGQAIQSSRNETTVKTLAQRITFLKSRRQNVSNNALTDTGICQPQNANLHLK